MKTFSKSPAEKTYTQVSCALCGGEASRRLYEEESLWVRCGHCGLVYQDPQPVRKELLDRYDEEYFDYELANETQFFDLMKKGLTDIGFDGLPVRSSGERSFLDIGCATGMLIHWMQRNGWKEQGVEVCRPAVEYGRRSRRVEIFAGILEDAHFDAASFDVVHCSHLIEHLNDPSGFLREVSRILIPGGYAIVTTPNISGLQSKLFRAAWRSMIPDHLYLFSVSTLKRLFEREGYTVLRYKTWGGLGVGTAPRWIKLPADRLAKLLGIGDVMIMLAQKAGQPLSKTPP